MPVQCHCKKIFYEAHGLEKYIFPHGQNMFTLKKIPKPGSLLTHHSGGGMWSHHGPVTHYQCQLS